MSTSSCAFLLITVLVSCVYSAKILGVFTIPSISHQIVFQPIWKELSLRGHEVTIMSPNPLHDSSLTNLTEIDLSFLYKQMQELTTGFSNGLDHWRAMDILSNEFVHLTSELLRDKQVQNVISDNTISYDVIFIEAIDPIGYIFAAKFKCPFIGVTSLNVLNPTHAKMGTPSHPTLHPDVLTPYYGGQLSFLEKVDAVLFDLYQRYLYDTTCLPLVNSIAKKYFGDEVPDLIGIEKNMSMLFLNTNPIIHRARPYGPNVIEFGGGIHIKPPKPLPLVRNVHNNNK